MKKNTHSVFVALAILIGSFSFISVTQAQIFRVNGMKLNSFGGKTVSVAGKNLKTSIRKVNDVEVNKARPKTCGAGQYKPSTTCMDVGTGYFSPAGSDERTACPTNSTTTTATAGTINECLGNAGWYNCQSGTCEPSEANSYSPVNDNQQYACGEGGESPAGSGSEGDCVFPEYSLQTSTIGGLSSGVYLQNSSGLYWATADQNTSVKYKTSSTEGEPTWNAATGTYSYPAGESASQYPAFAYCENLGGAGANWRLPTIDELAGIFRGAPCGTEEYGYSGCTGPAPYSDLPGIASARYWSSVQYRASTSYAWYAYMTYGQVVSSSKSYVHVRALCVSE